MTLPHCDPKMKQALDPNYYPLNYVPKQEEDAPTLVDNLVTPPTKTTKGQEVQGEDKKENNEREYPKDKEEDRKEDKTQADSAQEADEDDDYLDYSDLDFIH